MFALDHLWLPNKRAGQAGVCLDCGEPAGEFPRSVTAICRGPKKPWSAAVDRSKRPERRLFWLLEAMRIGAIPITGAGGRELCPTGQARVAWASASIAGALAAVHGLYELLAAIRPLAAVWVHPGPALADGLVAGCAALEEADPMGLPHFLAEASRIAAGHQGSCPSGCSGLSELGALARAALPLASGITEVAGYLRSWAIVHDDRGSAADEAESWETLIEGLNLFDVAAGACR